MWRIKRGHAYRKQTFRNEFYIERGNEAGIHLLGKKVNRNREWAHFTATKAG